MEMVEESDGIHILYLTESMTSLIHSYFVLLEDSWNARIIFGNSTRGRLLLAFS